MSDRLAGVIHRCDGCGRSDEDVELNEHRVNSNRSVRYCNQCDALRDTYGIRREDHEQYCLQRLADQLARQREE